MNINQKNTEEQSKPYSTNEINKIKPSFCKKKETYDPLKKEIEFLKKEFEKEKDKFLRLFAEFENYKKRIQKERFDIFRDVHEQILIDLIPILDDFERGIKELKKYQEEHPVKGIFLIQEKFINILKEKELNKIKIKKGDDFNTDFHEAITQIPAVTEDLKGKIIEIIEAGYILKGKVIRHAKVIIGK
ncbi:nucleotide exchange factor GrpE [Blattabacterium cuenoti]|uniref:Protein GrpE n=1 Tax=Blattabacterium cuenoti STAT TaxID=1457030 RepID=A0A224AK65_9FLAO|nr:nucleotide exchange factor GrpE [Blattabacterium cuenoti]BBA17020.1 chaperone GrpE [Blattabacterium cuenoti STAT]